MITSFLYRIQKPNSDQLHTLKNTKRDNVRNIFYFGIYDYSSVISSAYKKPLEF